MKQELGLLESYKLYNAHVMVKVEGVKIMSCHPQAHLMMLMVRTHVPAIRGFSMLSRLKIFQVRYFTYSHAKFLFMLSLIQSLFNSYINIYRVVNYILSIMKCPQYAVIRHTNRTTDKQTKLQPISSGGS